MSEFCIYANMAYSDKFQGVEVVNMKVEQYVMAYGVEHDGLRAILPDGFTSLRPVLRFNAEIRDNKKGYIEFNTAVEKDGNRGWINIGFWDDIDFTFEGKKVTFKNEILEISFEPVGIEGACPAEKDNAGCYFVGAEEEFRTSEKITSNKEFCDCSFRWLMDDGAHGESIGATLPAYPEEVKHIYPKADFTVENVAKISCTQVLGTYVVKFDR